MKRIKSVSVDAYQDSGLVDHLQDSRTVIEGGFCIAQFEGKTFIKDEQDDCTAWDMYETDSIYDAMLVRLAEYIEVMGVDAYPEALVKFQEFFRKVVS